ncbi:hypothetical protein C8R44DRAFT_754013 [Mycena epipterygia]|nr:hypothetical protein C8R44DRAFT_754013 [Mycena epipterygia]
MEIPSRKVVCWSACASSNLEETGLIRTRTYLDNTQSDLRLMPKSYRTYLLPSRDWPPTRFAAEREEEDMNMLGRVRYSGRNKCKSYEREVTELGVYLIEGTLVVGGVDEKCVEIKNNIQLGGCGAQATGLTLNWRYLLNQKDPRQIRGRNTRQTEIETRMKEGGVLLKEARSAARLGIPNNSNRARTSPRGWDAARTNGGRGTTGTGMGKWDMRKSVGRQDARADKTRMEGKSEGARVEREEWSTCGAEEWDCTTSGVRHVESRLRRKRSGTGRKGRDGGSKEVKGRITGKRLTFHSRNPPRATTFLSPRQRLAVAARTRASAREVGLRRRTEEVRVGGGEGNAWGGDGRRDNEEG